MCVKQHGSSAEAILYTEPKDAAPSSQECKHHLTCALTHKDFSMILGGVLRCILSTPSGGSNVSPQWRCHTKCFKLFRTRVRDTFQRHSSRQGAAASYCWHDAHEGRRPFLCYSLMVSHKSDMTRISRVLHAGVAVDHRLRFDQSQIISSATCARYAREHYALFRDYGEKWLVYYYFYWWLVDVKVALVRCKVINGIHQWNIILTPYTSYSSPKSKC